LIECINIFFSDYIKEIKNIKIDNYNFGQLEKVKPILESISKNDETFYSLREFNQIYNTDIGPIKNCYYVSNSNWNEKYIFWFQLESQKYIKQYWIKYFVYPKYDLPKDCVYLWMWNQLAWCPDKTKDKFEDIISHTCKE